MIDYQLYHVEFCHQNLWKRGVCVLFVFVKAKLIFHVTLDKKNMGICAVELETKSSKLIVLSLYRVPTGDFNQLIKYLDDALKYLYKLKVELLICADINTDYLIESY